MNTYGVNSLESRKFLKIVIIGVVIIFFLVGIPLLNTIYSNLEVNTHNHENIRKNLKAGYKDESPILIDADATGVNAHNWTWAVSQDWCNGSGTEFNPYRISQIRINGMGINNCIEIRNSKNIYFTIDNCAFLNAGNAEAHQFAANVFLSNVKYGTIYLNDILGASSDLAMGIYINNCSYLQVQSNNISENRFHAIQLNHSFSTVIVDNIVYNNRYMGITAIEGCQTINITNNLVDRNIDGIGISGGSYSWIYNNTVRNNRIHGIICVDCYHIEIASNEVTSSAYAGMYIQECTAISLIANTIEKNEYGIIFKLSNTNHIYENLIKYNNYYPLWLYSSNYNRILGNTIIHNKETLTQIYCVSNEFIENTIFNDPEMQLLTITIITISFFVFIGIIGIRKWKKAELY